MYLRRDGEQREEGAGEESPSAEQDLLLSLEGGAPDNPGMSAYNNYCMQSKLTDVNSISFYTKPRDADRGRAPRRDTAALIGTIQAIIPAPRTDTSRVATNTTNSAQLDRISATLGVTTLVATNTTIAAKRPAPRKCPAKSAPSQSEAPETEFGRGTTATHRRPGTTPNDQHRTAEIAT